MGQYIDKNVDDIIIALNKKSKRDFPLNSVKLRQQVIHFSPAYRDFILKIIKNGSLKIRRSYALNFTEVGRSGEKNKLSKRAKNTVYASIINYDNLPHELGHAVDFWFGLSSPLSSTIRVNDKETLFDIFTKEFEEKKDELFSLIIHEYEDLVDSKIGKGTFALIKEGLPFYDELKSIKVDKKNKAITKKRNKLQMHLYNTGFVEAYYNLYMSGCYMEINGKYSPILDALSSSFDLSHLFLAHHSLEYYSDFDSLAVEEFFANLFEAKIASKHKYFDNLIKYLPKSFSAFEQLFVIFYDRIQNNKRFNDVIRKETISINA